tara:strand:- start:35 stop:2170 length:2136 start_codon:yes stop_codon:yes gene_type:complete
MATVDTLLVRIEADMSDLRRGLRKVERDVHRTTNKASASFKKLGGAFKLIAVGVVVRQAFIAGKAMVNLSSNIEEMEGKSKVVFGKFRQGVVSELEAFGDAVGRSTHELEGMASKIQDTFVPMGFARGEAAKLSVELTKLAVDTASFNNASDTATMEAFQSALVGNHETVRRFGVVITEATLKQELLTMGIKGGTREATNAQKVQARLNLITAGVADAQGDALRTADSYANSMRGLKSEFEELAGAVGDVFLPSLVKVIQALKTATAATKNFLQNMGIIEMPLDKAIKKTKSEIILLEAKFDKLNDSIATQEDASNGSGYEKFGDDKGTLESMRVIANQIMEEKKLLMKLQMDLNIDDLKRQRTTDSLKPEKKVEDKDLIAQRKAISLLEEKQEQINEITRLEVKANQTKSKFDIEAHAMAQDIFNIKSQFPKLSMEDMKGQLIELANNREIIAQSQQMIADAKEQKELKDKHTESIERGISVAQPLLEQQNELRKSAIDVMNAFNNEDISAQQMLSSISNLAHQMEMLNPIYAKFHDMASQSFDKVTNDLTDMAMSGKFNLDTLKDTFKNTMREMLREAIKTFIIKKALQAMLGGIGGAIGGSAGDFIANIGNSASGGSLSAGQPQIVGERGAELIVPKSASTVLNHHNTKNAMNSGKGTIINQVINVSAGVSQTVREEMNTLLPRIKQETMMSIADAKRRGGAFGASMG